MEGFLGEITPGLSISSSFSRQRRMGRTAQGEGMHEEKTWSVKQHGVFVRESQMVSISKV